MAAVITPDIPLRAWAAGLGLAAVLVFGSALSYLQNQRAEHVAVSVTHTYRALAELDAVPPLIDEMEDDLRMFLATGERRYLARSEQARAALRGHVEAYERLTHDDGAQRAQMGPLRDRLRERELAMGATAQAYLTGGSAAALAEIQTGRGRAAIDALDAQLGRMKRIERDELSKRVVASQRAARLAAWAPVATMVAGLLFLGMGLRMLRRASLHRAVAEAKSEAARRELEFVTSAAPVYLAHLDAQQRFLFVNDAYARRLGKRPAEVIGRTVREVLGPDAHAVLRPHLDRVLRGEPVEVALQVPYATVGVRDVLCVYVPDRDPGGSVVGVLAAVTDITSARQMERALQASETRFQVLADSVPVIVWNTRPDGSSAFVNSAWYEYTGWPRDAVPGRTWAQVVHPDDLPGVTHCWSEATGGGVPAEFTYRLRRADGAYRWFLGRVVPQRDAEGNVVQWFGTAADIEDEKETERLLREQQALLRDADRRKDEFIATLAHELRNPLAPIRNAATVLRQPGADERAREWASAVIQRQVGTMALLLDDLLDVSRITRGTLTLHRQGVLLGSVVDSAVEIARPALDARRHRLTLQLPEQPLELDVDPLRLSQVVANLLTNAAKYTDPGGTVTLAVSTSGDDLHIAVRDTGIGLAPESLQQIFRMFSQVRGSHDRSEGGLGIGLALVKGLVELHGGRVEAYSEGEGTGSEFRVLLPGVVTCLHEVEATTPDRTDGPGRPLRILVADDSCDGAESLALLLTLDGHEVRVANDGTSALALLRAYRPDVALLDIGMPEMDGYEVARAVRNEPWRRSMLLVALTGWGQEDDKRRATEAGFDVHLTKPIAPELLGAVIRTPSELRLAQ